MTSLTFKTFNFMDFLQSSVLFNFLKGGSVSIIMGVIAAFTTFITNYVWDSPEAVWTMVSLMIGNWVMEMYISIQASYILRRDKEKITPKKRAELNKIKFSIAKTYGIVFSLVLSFWLLSISWNLSKANPIYYFLPGFTYGVFTGAYVVSVYRKLTHFGFFPKNAVDTLKEKLSLKKQ